MGPPRTRTKSSSREANRMRWVSSRSPAGLLARFRMSGCSASSDAGIKSKFDLYSTATHLLTVGRREFPKSGQRLGGFPLHPQSLPDHRKPVPGFGVLGVEAHGLGQLLLGFPQPRDSLEEAAELE